MKWGWLFPMIGFLGCNNSNETSDEIDNNEGSLIQNSRIRSSKKVVQPTYNASAGRRVNIDPKISLPKYAIHSRRDVFSLLDDEKTVYQELKVDELYQKTDGFLDLVAIPESHIEKETKKNISVPFNRLVGSITGNGIIALVEMKDKKVIEITPGEIIEGWKLKYLDSDKLEFEHIGEGMPKKITITSKIFHDLPAGDEKQNKIQDLRSKEVKNKKLNSKISDINIREDLNEDF